MYLQILARYASERMAEHSRFTTSGVIQIRQTNDTAYTQGLSGVNQDGNSLFVSSLVVFFFLLCGGCLILRLYNLANNHFRHVLTAGTNSDRHTFFARNQTTLWPWIQRHVLYAPLFKHRLNKEIRLSSAVSIGTLPSRFHTFILAIYIISNIAYCLVLDFSQPKALAIAELRGRSGALAAINIIPTVLFAMRNNPFIPLLRVSYDTFNLFHRWTARIVIMESIVHVCAWAVNAVDAGGAQYMTNLLTHSVSFTWGAVAAIAFIVIAIQAWSPARHAFYEIFLVGHRILAFIALIGVYIHLDSAKLPQLPYIWLGGMIWIGEWIFRTTRIISYNYRSQRSTTVMVEAFDTEACRLTFDLVRPWKFRPGCHVHVYLPRISLLASHPFSVAWTKDVQDIELEEKLPTGLKKNLDNIPEIRTSVSLVVRARSGMTRQLYDKASAAPNKVMTMRGAIEGPYGGHESLDSYGTVLLFAAGVGITHQLGYVRQLLQGAQDGTVSARKIVLVWSIPTREYMEWVAPWMDEILAMPGRREFLHIYNYISKGSEVHVVSPSGTVEALPGRCEPQRIVDEVFVDRIGAMAVTVCGPGLFSDTVRDAVRKRLELGSVDFIEEAFTY